MNHAHRRRSLSLITEEERQKMEDIQRKSRKDPQMLPDHDRDKTPIADKIANQINDSVRTVSTTPPKSPQSSVIVRRSSSGTSNSSTNSDRSSRYSVGNFWKRASYVPPSNSSSSPIQSRIQKKKSTTHQEIDPDKKSESSSSKRAAFTRERSKTGLNLFGGRRRSIAITDEDYESIRAAKSYHDIRVQIEGDVIKSNTESTGKQRKNFGERPWTELEKLWRGRVKAPGPDLEEILASSRQHGKKSETLPTHYKTRITPEISHAKGYWPPPPNTPPKSTSPRIATKTPVKPTLSSPSYSRKSSNPKAVRERSVTTEISVCSKKPTTALPIEVTRKAVNLMSPAVFNSWMPAKPQEKRFDDFLKVW